LPNLECTRKKPNISVGYSWDSNFLNLYPSYFRPIPGFGNIALAIVSSFILAIETKRVFLIKDFSHADSVFSYPLNKLLLETSNWSIPKKNTLVSFASHDANSAYKHICKLPRNPTQRTWLIYSNMYFAPLIHIFKKKPIWHESINFLFRPKPHILNSIKAYPNYTGIHLRNKISHKQAQRLKMYIKTKTILFSTLYPSNYKFFRNYTLRIQTKAKGGQKKSENDFEDVVKDIWFLSQSKHLFLNKKSTFGYFVRGLRSPSYWEYDEIGNCKKGKTTEAIFQTRYMCSH